MKICFIDLGPWGIGLQTNGLSTEHWQDHGIGLLRTVLYNEGITSCVYSTKNYKKADEIAIDISKNEIIIMNVRTYNFHIAKEIAIEYKKINPKGLIYVGGMHASVDLKSMVDFKEFDKISVGVGVNQILKLIKEPQNTERVSYSNEKYTMDEMPWINRNLWPKMYSSKLNWPLENTLPQWGGGKMVSMITSNVCPWRCSFCNEASYIENIQRRSVDNVIAELNHISKKYGDFDFVVFHDSMFFQQPAWLEEFSIKYPKDANKVWPFWAAGRADTVRRWPELFKKLVLEANWRIVSIGLESGSNNTLKTLNKECDVSDNLYAIQLINNLGDQLEKELKEPVKLFSNVMWGVPGESREDILDTARMVKTIKRPLLSNSHYAPYPGGALGNSIIAEGQSLINDTGNNRDATSSKMRGIDYTFVNDVMAGRYDQEVVNGMKNFIERNTTNGIIPKIEKVKPASNIYVFGDDGHKKLSWGIDAEEALQNLIRRVGKEKLNSFNLSKFKKINQTVLQDYTKELK